MTQPIQRPAGTAVAATSSNGRATGGDLTGRAAGRSTISGSGDATTGGLERFDCYRLAVEMATLAATLVPRGHASLRDQLERASTSVVLNISEGWGHWQKRSKVQFYTIARGSLLESGAAIDLLRARGLANETDCDRAQVLCTRVGQMLGGLIRSIERRGSFVGRG